MLDFVLNFLFPPVCGICGKLDKNWLCNKCKRRLEKYERFELIKGKEKINKLFNFQDKNNESNFKIDSNRIQNLKDKTYEKIYFDEFLYCFEYKSLVRNLILKYKFSDCGYLSNLFVNVILNNKKINEILKSYDIMIPVPVSKLKKKIRGYNQTELITKHFKNYIEIDSKNLVKIRNTKTQSTLSANERIQNVKNAFELKDVSSIKNKDIILFDDIITTGLTINEISKILKEAGARKVLVLVIAKD